MNLQKQPSVLLQMQLVAQLCHFGHYGYHLRDAGHRGLQVTDSRSKLCDPG